MKITPTVNENIEKLQESIIKREHQERIAIETITSEVLTKLNISIDNLPQKCQLLLQQVCTSQASSEVDQLDPVIISLHRSREIAEKLDDEYEILKLRQKNEELQIKIDRNTRFLDQLKRDLALSRESLSKRSPNPETVQEFCRQMRQKVASYEESYEKAKVKLSKLSVPEHALPPALSALAARLAERRALAAELRRGAADVALAQRARDTLHVLRR